MMIDHEYYYIIKKGVPVHPRHPPGSASVSDKL